MADKISEIMYKFNARPVRKGFEGDTKDYGSIVEIFQESLDTIEEIMSMISNLIEVLDYNTENKLLVIELEDVLEDMLDKRDISNTWLEKAKIYTEKDKLYAFDKDFDKFV